jgi:hypothetical protein
MGLLTGGKIDISELVNVASCTIDRNGIGRLAIKSSGGLCIRAI